MELPLENVASTIVEKVSDGVIAKMNINEERRNREFTYQLKELEFYKSNYEKDLKDVFDFWFDLVRLTHIKDNKNISDAEKQKFQKEYLKLMGTANMANYKMKTIKYGGKETSRVLAIMNKLMQPKYDDKPAMTALYVWCAILAVLKKDILGQELDPADVIRVLVNDFDDHEKDVEETKQYIKTIYKDTYGENPKWVY